MKLIFNPLNSELNPIFHLVALLGANHIFHVSRVRVKWHEKENDEIFNTSIRGRKRKRLLRGHRRQRKYKFKYALSTERDAADWIHQTLEVV
jgi:hypothetical protein